MGLAPESTLLVKPFFGGAAAYANGKICLSLTKVGFAVKLPEVDRQELLAKGAQPLRYFPKAPIKKKYVVLPDVIMHDPECLRAWVKKCVMFVTAKES